MHVTAFIFDFDIASFNVFDILLMANKTGTQGGSVYYFGLVT